MLVGAINRCGHWHYFGFLSDILIGGHIPMCWHVPQTTSHRLNIVDIFASSLLFSSPIRQIFGKFIAAASVLALDAPGLCCIRNQVGNLIALPLTDFETSS